MTINTKRVFLTFLYFIMSYSFCFADATLPALVGSNAIDRGVAGTTQATFAGGAAINGQTYNQTTILTTSESADVRATIMVDPIHMGQQADLLVAAIYTLATGQTALFCLTKAGDGSIVPVTWNGTIEGLSVFENTTLADKQELSIYQGALPLPGQISIFFGYRALNSDNTTTLVYNTTPIQITVNAQLSSPTDNPSNPSTNPIGDFLASYDFRPNPNGFSFENYGNSDGKAANDLTAEDMISLFGQDKVCRSPQGECVLTAAARQWVEEQIKGMNGGHCEGMAVTSLRLRQGLPFKGKTSPADFQPGANTTFALSQDAMRNYIAYYFVTQYLKPVSTQADAILQKKPSEVLQMLLDSMNQGLTNLYTIGFYKPEYKEGHAVTPYAVKQKSENEFWIYVYDNNYPNDNERVFKIDRAAETWVYEGAATKPGEPVSTYRGDATTKTFGLTPQALREGPFECPFCNSNDNTRDAGDKTIEFSLMGEGKMLIQLSDGRRVGYDFDKEQEVNEIDGVKRIHPKHGLGKDIPPTYEIPIPEDNSLITVFISGKSLEQEVNADLMMTGPGYSVGFEDIRLDPQEALVMQIRPDGHEISFTASQDGETPAIFLAEDPDDDTSSSYIFDVGGEELEAEKTVTFTLDGDSLYISDDDGNEDEYDLSITRIDDTGDNHFKKDNVAIASGAKSRIEFDQWTGTEGDLSLYLDDEGDGFADEEAVRLEDED